MENREIKWPSIITLLLFVLLCGSVFLNYKLSSYLDEYDEQIERQDSMIRRLTFSNELVKEYFDISEDTITHTTTYSLKEEKRSNAVSHVTNYTDPIFIRDGKEMTSDELIASVNANDQATLVKIQKLVDAYNGLVHDYNELVKIYRVKVDSLTIQSTALKAIKTNYDIDYASSMEGDLRYVKVWGTKVDSALMLLPYFRHKLSYDSQKNVWIIEHEKKEIK